MKEPNLHPLINKRASYYDGEPGQKTAIEEFEEQYPVAKLLAWAEITAAKYAAPQRKGKGESEKDGII